MFRNSSVGLAGRHAVGLVTVVVLHVIGSVAGLAPLWALVELGRALLTPGPPDPERVWTVVAIGAAGVVLRLALTGVSSGLGHVIDGHVQLTLRRRLAAHLGRVPLGWLSRRRTGELTRLVGDDVSAVHPVIAHTPGELVSAFVVPGVTLAYLFTIDWRLTLVTLVPVVLAVLHVPLMMLPARTREEQVRDAAQARIVDAAVEFVQGIAVVKAYGGGARAHRAFRRAAEDFVVAFRRWVRNVSLIAASMQVVLSAPFVLLVILTGATVLVTSGDLPPADVLPFLVLGLGLTAAVDALGHGFDDLQAARRAVGRIRGALSVAPLPGPRVPGTPRGHAVELRGVDFCYDDDRMVLRGVDLRLAPGSVTALVGPSGSGKSTLVQLVPRFLDPRRGTVSIGGVDLRDLPSDELRRTVTCVFQDVRLLRTSIADNIALFMPEADRAEVVRAARLANIHERIMHLPRGYDSVFGEDAVLSGGEAQRVSIARALLANTPVLVLDEATAFLDPATERAVRTALLTGRKDRTVLVIAHRLDTIVAADTVVVLDDGVVVERGRPADLMTADGPFAALWRASQAAMDVLEPRGRVTEEVGHR